MVLIEKAVERQIAENEAPSYFVLARGGSEPFSS
jgi:hypothetical protein